MQKLGPDVSVVKSNNRKPYIQSSMTPQSQGHEHRTFIKMTKYIVHLCIPVTCFLCIEGVFFDINMVNILTCFCYTYSLLYRY